MLESSDRAYSGVGKRKIAFLRSIFVVEKLEPSKPVVPIMNQAIMTAIKQP